MKHKLQGLKMHFYIFVHGHILNPLWSSHDDRRRKRRAAIVKAKNRYLESYKDKATSIKAVYPDAALKPEPEHAFTIWLQGEKQAPPMVQACFRSMHKYLELPLVILDENTLFDWITLPDHIMDKWRRGLITRTHFSDICRIELLYEHGGIWADATDLFTAPVPEKIMDEDLFMFMVGNNIKLGGTHAFIQSCFIRGKKGNPLLGMWREFLFHYWKEENTLLDYFTLHFLLRFLVQNNPEAAALFAEMPKIDQDPTHVLFYEYRDAPYSPELFEKITSPTFFQKTTYKNKSAKEPIPGTILEHVINN